ncbi:MAG TPA: caspase family protein [Longimicrobium sp.]
MAARGISLHVGVNVPDRELFHTMQTLKGCRHDARALCRVAASQGFETRLLLGKDATLPAVTAAIAAAAEEVGSDGIFLLTYSGHGSRLWDEDGDEGDGYDETWCLARGELVDDELYRLWGLFPPGARVVVVSDSCHSGTVIRRRKSGPKRRRRAPSGTASRGGKGAAHPVRRMGAGPRRPTARAAGGVAASVVLLAAAMDTQTARDGAAHGAYTGALLAVWNGGAFRGSYLDFQGAIHQRLRAKRMTQQPYFDRTGAPNPAFEAQRPFTIEPPTIEPPPPGTASAG